MHYSTTTTQLSTATNFYTLLDQSTSADFNVRTLKLTVQQIEQLIAQGTDIYNRLLKSSDTSRANFRVYVLGLIDELETYLPHLMLAELNIF